MKGYSHDRHEGETFADEMIRDWRLAAQLVDAIAERKPLIRCHELARAVLRFLECPWDVIDGHFGSAEHTWLAVGQEWASTLHPSYRLAILDVYAVARLPMVQLVFNRQLIALPYDTDRLCEPKPAIDVGLVSSLASEMLFHRFAYSKRYWDSLR